MSNRLYAIVGRHGDDGGRYLTTQWPQMKKRAWAMYQAGDLIQVWRAMYNGDLLSYDSEATRRMSDHLIKTREFLKNSAPALSPSLEGCECGRGHIVTLPNGERICSDTLLKFELQHGRPYKPSAAIKKATS